MFFQTASPSPAQRPWTAHRLVQEITLLLLVLPILQSCAATVVASAIGASRQLGDANDAVSAELGINIWKDADQVEKATATLPVKSDIDMRNYAGVVAPAWSYGGVALRIAADYGRDNMVHGYKLQARARSRSGVPLQVGIEGVGDLPQDGADDAAWLNFPLDRATTDSIRQLGGVVRVRCEVGDWTFRLTPGYMLGFEAKLRALKAIPASSP